MILSRCQLHFLIIKRECILRVWGGIGVGVLFKEARLVKLYCILSIFYICLKCPLCLCCYVLCYFVQHALCPSEISPTGDK